MANQKTQHDDVVTSMPHAFTRHFPVSPRQSLFLMRLSRLLRLNEEWRKRRPANDWRLRLIHKGIYSTYCDCIELGVVEEAHQLIERSRGGGGT